MAPVERAPHAFIGRDRERAALDGALAALDSSGPALVEITGEPGIGKTWLLDELRRRARARGAITLAGRASELERTIPLGVIIEAIEAHLAELGVDRLRRLADGPTGCLRHVLPALARAGSETSGPPPAEGERHRLFRGVRLLLERLAPARGLVVALDDVHWADPATIELLAYLRRRPPRAAVLIVLAYRSRQVPARLAAALTGTDGLHIEVGPLSLPEAEQLIGEQCPRPQRRALYAICRGNPLYLLAASRLATEPAIGAGTEPGEASARPRQALLAEFSALSADALQMAWAGAVVGDPFMAGVAAIAAGLLREGGPEPIAPNRALRGLDELVERDVVRRDAGPRFRFRHPLLRHVAYTMAGAGWRLAAHARMTAYLGSRGESSLLLARHLEQIAEPGDERAVAVFVDAARTVLGRAPAAAAHWLRVGLRLLDTQPAATDRRLELLTDLAHAHGLAGHLHASRATCHQLLAALPDEQVVARARVAAACAMADRLLGRHGEARALLLRMLDTVPLDQPAAAGLTFELAAGSLMRGDFAANRRWAALSLALARRHRDRPVQAAALSFLAMASYVDADVPTAARLLDDAADLVDGLSDGELAGRLDAALFLGWNETYLGRTRPAVRHLERGVAVANATGQVHLLPLLSVCLALVHRWQGRLSEAASQAENAVDTAELSASAELRSVALTTQSWVASWTGDVRLALSAARAAVVAAEPLEGWLSGVAGAMLARAQVVAGEPAGCVDLITASLGGPDLPAADPWSRVSWYEVLVRAELALGRVDAAYDWVSRAEKAANALGSIGHAGLALLARAQVLATQDRPAEAGALAGEAANVLAEAGCRLDAARAELLAGTVTPATDQARAALRRAERLFAACGAGAMVRQTRRELRRLSARLGERRSLRRDPPPALYRLPKVALTTRQAEIGALVAAGLTNREIARRLGVSTKTVEMHLSHLFARVGVPSRAGLASYMTRADYGSQES